MKKITVRTVNSDEDRAALYEFRYKIYVNEFRMTNKADHKRAWLCDDYDEYSLSYALYENNEIVGSLRCIFLSELPDAKLLIEKFRMRPAIEAFGLESIGTTSRFMIAPHLRNTRYVLRLMNEAFLEGQRRGVRFNYGDCSPHLLPFYERLGYRRYTAGYNDTAFGYKVPILMLTQDRSYLLRVRSPLSPALSNDVDDCFARQWFLRTYPAYANLESSVFLPEGAFFDLLAERVASNPLHSLTLLKGLERSEAERFLRKVTVLRVGPGDRIIRKGEWDNTVFVLLSGKVEVVVDDTGAPPIAVLKAGDTFGEVAYLNAVQRTADVVVRSAAEMLVLSGDMMDQFVSTHPNTGTRVLSNLSRALEFRRTFGSRTGRMMQ